MKNNNVTKEQLEYVLSLLKKNKKNLDDVENYIKGLKICPFCLGKGSRRVWDNGDMIGEDCPYCKDKFKGEKND